MIFTFAEFTRAFTAGSANTLVQSETEIPTVGSRIRSRILRADSEDTRGKYKGGEIRAMVTSRSASNRIYRGTHRALRPSNRAINTNSLGPCPLMALVCVYICIYSCCRLSLILGVARKRGRIIKMQLENAVFSLSFSLFVSVSEASG